ncbi:MAG: single-stranded DNA-binding protein, partial [Phycisphaerae bacterium]|nr:single-stranded DNA-binding protein [Phycisphaerae bacterium]
MANYNKVILMGNLTRDPQLSYLPSQTPVVEIGLAVNRKWKGQDGQKREEACFVDCRAYGKQAEVMNQYLSKGRPILIEGRLQLSSWEDKEGNKRSKLRVVVERFQFLGGGQG